MSEGNRMNAEREDRRNPVPLSRGAWFSSALMAAGLLASYGTLLAQTIRFLLPSRTRAPTRKLFVGAIAQFDVGSVQTLRDLEGNKILVRRSESGFRAFKSVCPHLGCKVHWVADDEGFFCPCHNGKFNAEGVAISGPPAKANQSLYPADLIVDDENQVLYLKVPDRGS